MTSNSVTKLHPARCSQSHIVYRCDLQHSGAVQINLGILIELVGPDWHSLGVAMRTGMYASEIASLASTWHSRLTNPFEYFESEYEKAWREAPHGQCIDWLAEKYSGSLFVEPASDLPHQRVVQDGCATEEAIRLHVFGMLDAEAKHFLNPKRSPAVIIESEPAAAA